MSNNGPHEDAYTLYTERTFIASNFVAAIGYGALIVLYCLCASYLVGERKSRGRVVYLRVAYITALILLASFITFVPIWTTGEVYINNRNYPSGPMGYLTVIEGMPISIAYYAAIFIISFLSDLLVFWRCWVIWSPIGKTVSYAVMAVPALVLLASIALGTVWLARTSQPAFSIYSTVALVYGAAYFLTSVSVNVVVTALIIVRLLLHRRAVSHLLPPDFFKGYLSVAAIVVESALLYSIFGVAFVVTYAVNNPISQVFTSISLVCQQIAGYLIILRVAQGRAWTSTTLASETVAGPITTIHFNHGDDAELGHCLDELPRASTMRSNMDV
ncbi:hypothetical protein APHAL10511_003090 [Amanita phalloides]|nr:hypothetical protein APHAL10511_003090 [Amanita phalloides]